ncbi:MAG TPA: anthranilate synthase component I, partial [Rhizobiaceae bacterium]|nr:anthranilate synthase component I [Rhizobiaceae bacterium]
MTAASTESNDSYETQGGVTVSRHRRRIAYGGAIARFVDALDNRLGVVLSSNYEFPGRYTRWDTATMDPPLMISAAGRDMRFSALNARGRILLGWLQPLLFTLPEIIAGEASDDTMTLTVRKPDRQFTEEERSRAPSVFSVLRAITGFFHAPNDDALGLFGAFGYDLCFQFDPIDFRLQRPDDQRDLVLFLPDEIVVVDHHAVAAWQISYDFAYNGQTTDGLPRETPPAPFKPSDSVPSRSDHQPGEYAALVTKAKESFRRGDLFEVVPGQMFQERCEAMPSEISRRLKAINPSPYSFFMNIGEGEYLIGASPEMFVRVTGRRIETCPISGTIRRGRDAIEDSEQILKLLNSKKDESELTMCSDVDRNDKSRVCDPGSVRVIGRRQIEMYSRLIHTVDHIEGRLREGMDAFDGFLSHAWAVTVTGAPKLWAMRFIESNEKSPRA